MFDFRFNTHSYFPESGSGKRFQAPGMRAIDSPHEITPKNMILREKFQNFSIFASIHTSISLNQGQHFHALGMRAIDFSHDFTPR